MRLREWTAVQTRFDPSVVDRVIARIEHVEGRPFTVAVDGPGGSGKSTLAGELAAAFPGRAIVVHGDDFYADLDAEYRASLDAGAGYREYFDWRRLRDQVLAPARAGAAIEYQRYDWDNARIGDWVTVPDTDLLVVEGVYSSRPELRDLSDLVLWVTTSEDVRRRRQIDRQENDGIWISRWMAAEDYYLRNIHRVGPDDIEVLGE